MTPYGVPPGYGDCYYDTTVARLSFPGNPLRGPGPPGYDKDYDDDYYDNDYDYDDDYDCYYYYYYYYYYDPSEIWPLLANSRARAA